MSVNIYDGTNLIQIAGKTVPAPTPDYVDAQFNPSTTYSKGMTCIEGNVRYRYKNSTATSGHRPPDTTYWEVFSVATELNTKQGNTETLLFTYVANTSDFTTGGSTYKYGYKVDTNHETDLRPYKNLKLNLYSGDYSLVQSVTIDLDEQFGLTTANTALETEKQPIWTDGSSYVDGFVWGRVDINAVSYRKITFFYILWWLRTAPTTKFTLRVYGIN